MTQAKKTASKKSATIDLRSEFLKLDPKQQAYVGHFFALHNAAHQFYDLLNKDSQNYVNYCIRLSQEKPKEENV